MNNYKKYLEKTKKNKPEDSQEKQTKDFTELYKKFNLKYNKGGKIPSYSDGTSDVEKNADEKRKSFFESLQEAFSSPELAKMPSKDETREEKYKRIREENAQQFGHSSVGYSNGTSNVQSPYEAGIEAKARRAAILKAAGISEEQSPEEIEIEASEKKRREQEPEHYADGTPNVPMPDVLKLPSSEENNQLAQSMLDNIIKSSYAANQNAVKKINEKRAKDASEEPAHYAEGTSSVSNDDADLQAKAQKYGWTPEHVAYLKSLRSDIPERRVEQPIPVASPPSVEEGIHLDPNAAQNVAEAFANGGMVKSHTELYKKFLSRYGNLSNTHAPAQIKAYADGTPSVPDVNMVTDRSEEGLKLPSDVALPKEEQAALEAADSSTQGQIQQMIDEHNGSQDVLQQIDKALGNEAPEEEYQKIDPNISPDRKPILPMSEEEESSDEQHAKESPYGNEEEEALKASDATTAAQTDKEDTGETLKEAVEKDKESPKSEEEAPVSEKMNPMDELKNAQEQQRNAILGNQIGRISDIYMSSKGHYQPTMQDYYKDQEKNAELPVKQLEQRITMENFDPNSDTSKAFAAYMVKFGGPNALPKGIPITAAMGEKLIPLVFKDKERQDAAMAKLAEIKQRGIDNLLRTKETVQGRKDVAEMNAEAKKLYNQQRADQLKDKAEEKKAEAEQRKNDKLEAKDLDRVDKMNKSLSAAMANSRSAFGTAARNRQNIENVKVLINGEKDLNDLDNRQIVEVARSLDKVLSGGVATMAGTEHLTPESARTWLAKKLEFITNKRKGAGAGSFLKTMSDTINREETQANKQIKQYQNEFLGPYKSLAKNDPDSRSYQNYVETLKANHLEALLPENEAKEESKPKESTRTVVRKGYNPKTNQTQLIYDDGTKEIVEGKQ